jgi:hypothetical protein
MHVPGLKKNLVSVAMLEDRGYDVVFNDENPSCDIKKWVNSRR